MPLALEADRISFSYPGSAPVADGFSLALEDGQIGCLLGPSGCGKTTVLRCIAGLESIDAGEIRLHGVAVSRPRFTQAPESRRVGVVFQDYALFPHLTVEGNVGFGLLGAAKASRAQRVGELLEAVGMANAGRSYPHELSGGQKQRVALARALAPRPQLLLLDEPFSNLDVDLRERLSLEVRSILKDQGMTALLVTHDQHEAFAMADRVGVMRGGQIEQWDTAYNLYHRPATRFVADFVGEGVLVDTIIEGKAVSQLLRPDDVLHDDESPTKAEVLKKAFRGAEFLYTLRLEDGKQVLSLVPSHHNHAIGERIGVKLDVDHVVSFPRDEKNQVKSI